jgi:hypothetical protein
MGTETKEVGVARTTKKIAIRHFDHESVRFPRGTTHEILSALTYEAAIAPAIIENIVEPPQILPPNPVTEKSSMDTGDHVYIKSTQIRLPLLIYMR